MARIASGNCGSVWSQTFTYDAFGNITKTGSGQFQPGYNWQTNQMSTGASYDSNGDVLSDGLHSYAWDVETRPTTIDTVSVTYDALERMVEQNKSGSYTEIVYAPLGNKLALMNGTSTLVKAFAPLPAGATAVYNASGLQYYRHPDWLGSSRFSSTPSRTMYNDLAFAPFGEQYAQSGSAGVTDTSFAGNNEDTTTNLYDAQFREYGIQGRWPSPDPAGAAAVNPANPQSWNRYAYVLNGPLDLIDPLGLEDCTVSDGVVTLTIPCPTASVTVDGYNNSTDNLFGFVADDGGGGRGSANPFLILSDHRGGGSHGSTKPQTPTPPCLAGAGPLAPGQSYCAPQAPTPQPTQPKAMQSYGACVFETAVTDSFWSGVGMGGAALVVPPVLMGVAGASVGPEGAIPGAGLGLAVGVAIAPEVAGSAAVDGLAAGTLHGLISCAFR